MAFVYAPDFHGVHVAEQWIFRVTRGRVSHDHRYIFHISRWFTGRVYKQTNSRKASLLQMRHVLMFAAKTWQQLRVEYCFHTFLNYFENKSCEKRGSKTHTQTYTNNEWKLQNKVHLRASPNISLTFCIRTSSYRRAVALYAWLSFSVRPFHLPAVTEDLGHHLESGVRRSGDSSLCVYVGVCDVTTRVIHLHILNQIHLPLYVASQSDHRRQWRKNKVRAQSEGRGPVSRVRYRGCAEEAQSDTLSPLLASDRRRRRTERLSALTLADAHKGIRCGFTAIQHMCVCVMRMVCAVAYHNCM